MRCDGFRQRLIIRSHVLPFFRRYDSKSGREQCMSCGINWPVFYFCTCRVLAKKVVTLPVLRRSDGSRNEATATVRTDIAQDMLNTGGAECTFIGADACLK
jgi:hypothetical protein